MINNCSVIGLQSTFVLRLDYNEAPVRPTPVETTVLEESTDEPEIDEEFEEAKPIFKRYQILIKKLMKEKMMNRRSGQRTKDYVFERWKNDCGIPPSSAFLGFDIV